MDNNIINPGEDANSPDSMPSSSEAPEKSSDAAIEADVRIYLNGVRNPSGKSRLLHYIAEKGLEFDALCTSQDAPGGEAAP